MVLEQHGDQLDISQQPPGFDVHCLSSRKHKGYGRRRYGRRAGLAA